MKDDGKDWPQILSIIIACMPGLSSALILTWSATFIPVLLNDKINYNLSEEDAKLLPIMTGLGCMVPALFVSKLPDLIGRKPCLILLSVPQAVHWIMTIYAKDVVTWCITKFIGGAADALMYAVLPIYIGEVTTPRVRGTWGNGQTFSFNAGFFLISAIGSYVTIQMAAYIFLTLPIIFVVIFLWIPESPYYYVIKGKDEKARSALQWFLRKEKIEPDFQQLKKDVQRQISETGTWADIFKIKSNRRALISCIFVRYSQQLAGISVFEQYFQYIFEKANTSLSPEISAMIFSGALWLIMTGFSFALDIFGRKKSFIYSSLGCAIWMGAISAYFYIDEFQKDIDLSALNWIPIVSLMFYLCFYCFGLGILPSLMAGELFSASIKGKALSLANAMMGLIVLVVNFIFKTLSRSAGLYAPFAFFAFSTFICFILSFYLVPETRGKTLEEIQQDLKSSKKKNKECAIITTDTLQP